MKLSVVRRVAEKAGCAADVVKGDEKALRAWLVENVDYPGADGKSLDFATEKFEADDAKADEKPKAKKSIKPDDVTDEEPADLAAKVNALVTEQVKAQLQATIKALKFSNGTTVPVIGADDPVAVRSVEERIYEDQAKAGRAFFKSVDHAIGCRRWLATIMSGPTSRHSSKAPEHIAKWQKWCEHNEKALGGTDAAKAMSTTSVTGGAAVVPDVWQPDLIRNVLERGVARRLAKVVTMTAKAHTYPRRTGGISGGYPGENTAPTESNPTYDAIGLSAHSFVTNTQASNEMFQDSGLSVMDMLMEELSYTVATQEDNILLIADGSATYATMTGFEYKFGVTSPGATTAGYAVEGGTTASAHTAANIDTLIGRVPQYARAGMVFTCSPTIKAEVFDRLSTSTPGGLLLSELVGFGLISKWKNIPIIENNSMSSVIDANATNRTGFTAADQIDILLGNFQRAALFGDRVGIEIAVSDQRGFLENATWLRVVARHDVNVHNSHDTGAASSTKAGPVVSFWQT